MGMENFRVLVVDDSVNKSIEIKRALMSNGIKDILLLGNQEDVWEEIERVEETDKKIDLIVTDMNYPLSSGQAADPKAGFILLDELKGRGIHIPVIICSSINYDEPEALGCVWYSDFTDMDFDFKQILKKLQRN